MIERSIDKENGIIRVKVTGPWQEAELLDHFVKLRQMIESVRARKLPVRIAIDLRSAEPPGSQIEARIAEMKRSTYLPGDRIAVITNDLASKFHVRGFLNGVDAWAWQSELAADQWLLIQSAGLRAS